MARKTKKTSGAGLKAGVLTTRLAIQVWLMTLSDVESRLDRDCPEYCVNVRRQILSDTKSERLREDSPFQR